MSRRQFLGVAAGLALVGGVPPLAADALIINPRESWATGRPPKGALDAEDVRFLIVHHSASGNGHGGADAPGIIRSYYDYHTSAEKGWNDIAYNFLIDADGGIWEGRAGSLDGPVAGDATGGNQGFSQLVCLIGDFNTSEPSPAASMALVRLSAWLADRYQIATRPGSRAGFTSRGSNLHPAGSDVTTATITGHRTMSETSCPGDNLNDYVIAGLMADVEAVRSPQSTSTTTTTPTISTTTVPTTTTTFAHSTTGPFTTSTPAPSTTAPLAVDVGSTDTGTGGATVAVAGAAGAVVATGAGVLLWRHRRMSR